VQKLPYEIVNPKFYRAEDDLYSLYVLERVKDGGSSEQVKYRYRLREVSVPDSELYPGRVFELENILEANGFDVKDLAIHDIILSSFRIGSTSSSLFMLTNKGTGFQKIGYRADFDQLSIDSIGDLREALSSELWNQVIKSHMETKHESGDQSQYFTAIWSKIHQYADGFSTFDVLPTEFGET